MPVLAPGEWTAVLYTERAPFEATDARDKQDGRREGTRVPQRERGSARPQRLPEAGVGGSCELEKYCN